VDQIDAVSGATVSYKQFAEATEKALKAAGKVDAVGSANVSLEQKVKDILKKILP
jgi:major membrane immunogen (membrane-anchored lipoprotein)